MTRLPRTVPPPPPSVPLASGSLEKTALPKTKGYATDVNKSRPTPWYRTTKGIEIIIIVAFVVVGVIIGVAVGVTLSMKNKSTPQEPGRSGGGVQTKSEGQNSHTVALPSLTFSIAAPTSAGSEETGGGGTSGNNNPSSNSGRVPITSGVPPSNG